MTEAAKFNLVRVANIRENKIIEEFGVTLNFIAVLIPTLMAFFTALDVYLRLKALLLSTV